MSKTITLSALKQAQTSKPAKDKPKPDATFEAPNLGMTIGDVDLDAAARVFSSGSVGWGYAGRIMVHGVECQASINIVVRGSKPKPEAAEAGHGPVKLTVPGKQPSKASAG